MKPAINMSGVVLHTGLGRARLSEAAIQQVLAACSGHANVELDLETGLRGDRQSHVRDLLRELTGAEDALVVNNAAAGVFLALAALAQGREVILSRGQMVEIGGSFRLPDIVRQSGCTLVEVGCTNKTRLSDYEEAISESTAAVLRCHPSNFKMIGFVEEPSPEDLAALCRQKGLLFIDDVGSGCLVDTTTFGLPKQFRMQDAIAAGADVAIASGDKLLGGPQAGLVLGRKEVVSRLKRHPLARAMRVDKLTLAALEATLRLYMFSGEEAVPTLRYLKRDLDEVRKLAERLAQASGDGPAVEEGTTEVGGGSAPGTGVPTYRVGLRGNPNEHAMALRRLNRPVIGRIEDDIFWLDPRTAEAEEVDYVADVLSNWQNRVS